MEQYLDLVENVLTNGIRKKNRTGIDTFGIHGAMMKFNLQDGFPILTTKRVPFKMVVGEMLAFLRGYDNAAQFRDLGCTVWDQNANENKQWLNNPNRKGTDDLGRVYGVQSRKWKKVENDPNQDRVVTTYIDQLLKVYNDLKDGIDNRREIVSHWNPSDMDKMALPPCHLLYQFGIHGDTLNLSMYQRSCDVGLGVPFNIAGYAWLLSVMAHITGLRPGTFTHFLHDVHIYENHIFPLKKQLLRSPRKLPTLTINDKILNLSDLETWVRPGDFRLEGYQPMDAIKMEMAV